MSDFLWTDKSSEKWYIIFDQGHEGPYSLLFLEEKLKNQKINSQVKIWAEGLESEMTLEAVIHLSESEYIIIDDSGEFPPPLPPLPIDNDSDKASTPVVESTRPLINSSRSELLSEDIEESDEDEVESTGEEELAETEVKRFSFKHKILAGLTGVMIVIGGALYILQSNKKDMGIHRPQGMSLKVSERVENYLQFKSWGEPLFFKEFTSDDLSVIWLASPGFQKCEVTAHFKSQKDKLLTMGDEVVEFEGNGELTNHLTELKKFSFLSGKKIIPGMYDMSISASNCRWDGLISKLMNLGRTQQENYQARMSVILYPKGVEEFRELLDRMTKKKMEKTLYEQNQAEMFWQNVQEKLQTLLAISLQVEQHFLDFLKKNERQYQANLKGAIAEYTKKYGYFLTQFVVSNAESFKELSKLNVKGISSRKNYELQISSAAKDLGHTSMKLIEDLNDFKNPRRTDLNQFENRVKRDFAKYKENLNQKIIQVSDDRSLPPDADSAEQSPSQK